MNVPGPDATHSEWVAYQKQAHDDLYLEALLRTRFKHERRVVIAHRTVAFAVAIFASLMLVLIMMGQAGQ